MMKILYHELDNSLDIDFESYLQLLPTQMQDEIRRYRNLNDRKSRLISRLMLKSHLYSSNQSSLIYSWNRDIHNKPFISNGINFNISHSGDIVLFATSNLPIGIDVEFKSDLNFDELIDFFHEQEISQISNSASIKSAFFEIWVKKEAFLKAIGIGLTIDIRKYNCSNKSIFYLNKEWFFHRIDISEEYESFVCCLESNPQIHISKYIVNLKTLL
ncbi:4'-phosphopantetheinyl transferase family protein [Pedobacter roseus]|uniref:4'-phosphopantetheinyl transferase superfamily protein n=1 Tax=Pedobacter roseus TaxID=336820 RepID=A0A7G9QKT5_9SPHI|nr:4'-phosphopantetheinyl transferase superfamily protein [Pedobacter roseus]QNN43960.1 4'-phosphopantetheinyl transferase superfamily protein [Pedobacter roseus]